MALPHGLVMRLGLISEGKGNVCMSSMMLGGWVTTVLTLGKAGAVSGVT